MVSVEILRQYSFFAKLSEEQLEILANASGGETVKDGDYVCKLGEKLDHFFLVLEGSMEVLFELPKLKVEYKSPGQTTQLQTESVRIGNLGPGDICGWSGLVPPHISTSSVRAVSPCKIIRFNSKKLLDAFDDDCRFGFIMIQSAAQAIGKRIQAIYHPENEAEGANGA